MSVEVMGTGFTESNKGSICESIAMLLIAVVRYCSLNGPVAERRNLQESTLYMDLVDFMDIEYAEDELDKDDFGSSLEDLPLEVTITGVIYATFDLIGNSFQFILSI